MATPTWPLRLGQSWLWFCLLGKPTPKKITEGKKTQFYLLPFFPIENSLMCDTAKKSCRQYTLFCFAKKERKTSFVLPPFFGQILNEIKVVNQTEKKSFRFNRVSRIFVSFGKMPVDFISVCPRLCGRKVWGVSKQVIEVLRFWVWIQNWARFFYLIHLIALRAGFEILQRSSSNSWDKSALPQETSMLPNSS